MSQDELKLSVARAALDYIPDGKVIGVGTGSTANFFIDELAKIRDRIPATVASSKATAERLASHGIRVLDLNEVDSIPVYIDGADEISASDLDYTIIRPAWLTDKDEVDYETTKRGEKFKGTEVSRKSIGNLVAEVIANPAKYARQDLGVNKPNIDGDKPAWY